MSVPISPPEPTLPSWWCPVCGRQHMPYSGPLPSRHYGAGVLCRGEWLPLTYRLVEPVPPAVEEAKP